MARGACGVADREQRISSSTRWRTSSSHELRVDKEWRWIMKDLRKRRGVHRLINRLTDRPTDRLINGRIRTGTGARHAWDGEIDIEYSTLLFNKRSERTASERRGRQLYGKEASVQYNSKRRAHARARSESSVLIILKILNS